MEKRLLLYSVLIVLILASILPVGAAGPNLLINPGFETGGIDPWYVEANGVWDMWGDTAANYGRSGEYIQAFASDGMDYACLYQLVGLGPITYTFSGWVLDGESNEDGYPYFEVTDNAGYTIMQEVLPAGEWYQFSYNGSYTGNNAIYVAFCTINSNYIFIDDFFLGLRSLPPTRTPRR